MSEAYRSDRCFAFEVCIQEKARECERGEKETTGDEPEVMLVSIRDNRTQTGLARRFVNFRTPLDLRLTQDSIDSRAVLVLSCASKKEPASGMPGSVRGERTLLSLYAGDRLWV